MKRILSLVLTLSMLLSCVLLAEAEAPAKLSICSPDNTFGLSTDPELQQAVVNMLNEACNVDLEAVIPPIGSYNDKLETMMAGGDVPDVFSISQAMTRLPNYVTREQCLDLTDLIAKSEKLSALSSDILGAFQKLSETSAVLLEAQKALAESIDNRVVKEKEATDALGGNLVETAELMRVNQSELSANLEMLRAGLETILEKLSGDTAERDEEESFVEHLNQSLEAFHERASEVLMENAVKTQEILLEVLEQTQRKPEVSSEG